MANTDSQRARGYRVLARLLEDGAEGVEPAVAAVFDATAKPEELRSEYVAAFDLGVPPYASAFLEADRCVGGHTTASLADRMQTGASTGPAACHLGVQLAYVARRLDAGDAAEARAFVREAILSWLPSFAVVLAEQPVPFWRAVVSQTLDLAADHAGSTEVPPQPVRLADVPAPLRDSAGLGDIASWLATPAAVGTFISDADLVTIGRRVSLPRGFGSRPERIETLLRSAADYGCVAKATEGVGELLERRRRMLQALGETHLHPGQLRPWVERLEHALEVLATIGNAAAREGDPSEV